MGGTSGPAGRRARSCVTGRRRLAHAVHGALTRFGSAPTWSLQAWARGVFAGDRLGLAAVHSLLPGAAASVAEAGLDGAVPAHPLGADVLTSSALLGAGRQSGVAAWRSGSGRAGARLGLWWLGRSQEGRRIWLPWHDRRCNRIAAALRPTAERVRARRRPRVADDRSETRLAQLRAREPPSSSISFRRLGLTCKVTTAAIGRRGAEAFQARGSVMAGADSRRAGDRPVPPPPPPTAARACRYPIYARAGTGGAAADLTVGRIASGSLRLSAPTPFSPSQVSSTWVSRIWRWSWTRKCRGR